MTDVIIVGGGPVGLWLACELKLAGVSVAVVERRMERVDQSRALSVHGRTLEIFGLRGLGDRFLASGIKLPTGHFAVLDKRLDFSVIDSSYATSLFITQKKTEELIEARAIELGVELLRGCHVEEVEEISDGVRVAWIGSDGRAERVVGYVVGADGARSIVRTAAAIDFPGSPGTFTGMMGDVVLGKPMPAPVVSTVNDRGCLMIAPLGDGKHHRIVVFYKALMHKAKTEPLTVEELAQATADVLGQDLEPGSDALWLSRFDNETRLAGHYRKGRILLAGDAAHIHLPAGGQGMNVGLHDATNLGWKLAMVVKGQAPEALLGTYHDERRKIGEYLHDNTLAQSLLITGFSPEAMALRAALNDLLHVPEANLHLAQQISGFGFSYPQVLLEDRNEEQWRVPDRRLILADGSQTTIYAHLAGGKWVHVSLVGEPEIELPNWLDRENVEYLTVREAEADLFGAAAVLVRPDGHAAITARAQHH